jgi:hypothetical protein
VARVRTGILHRHCGENLKSYTRAHDTCCTELLCVCVCVCVCVTYLQRCSYLLLRSYNNQQIQPIRVPPTVTHTSDRMFMEVVYGFHKMLGNYRMATQLLASRVVLRSRELVICEPQYVAHSHVVTTLSTVFGHSSERLVARILECDTEFVLGA